MGVSYLGGIAHGIATGRVRGRGVNDEPTRGPAAGMQKVAAVAAPDRRLRVRPGWLEASSVEIGALTPASGMPYMVLLVLL